MRWEAHLEGDVCGHTQVDDVETHKLLNRVTSCVAPDNSKDFNTQKSCSLHQRFDLPLISSIQHFRRELSYFENNHQLRDDFEEQNNRFSVYVGKKQTHRSTVDIFVPRPRSLVIQLVFEPKLSPTGP